MEKQLKNDDMIEFLYNEYKTDVFRFALSIIKDIQDAQDIVGDVFCKASINLSQLRNPEKAKVWLLTVTKNLSIDFIRKRSVEIDFFNTSFDNQIECNDFYSYDYFQMIECLDEIERKIVTLHIVNGLKHNEISKILSLSHSLIRKRYSRALEKIRIGLKGEIINGSPMD